VAGGHEADGTRWDWKWDVGREAGGVWEEHTVLGCVPPRRLGKGLDSGRAGVLCCWAKWCSSVVESGGVVVEVGGDVWWTWGNR
jgi:hypothetical protein